jgi:cytochrome b6-f complex iron-sulfur subunit
MSETNGSISRRQFCAGAYQAATGITLATLLPGCGGGSPTSPSDNASMLGRIAGRFSGSTVQVTVPGSPLADVNSAALVESTAGVFLVSRTAVNSFTAVDAVCTHEGCTITGATGSEYVCPCHGSRYTRNGQIVAGPARASLRQYRSTFADDVLTITL